MLPGCHSHLIQLNLSFIHLLRRRGLYHLRGRIANSKAVLEKTTLNLYSDLRGKSDEKVIQLTWLMNTQSSGFSYLLKMYVAYYRNRKIQKISGAMIGAFLRVLLSGGRHFLMSAVCLASYDWENKNIPKDKLIRSASDLHEVDALCQTTIYCKACGKRLVIDKKISGIDYCICGGKLGYASNNSSLYNSWEPFLEMDNVIVWRKPHPQHENLYMYKVYGKYSDTSLNAFMETQLNTDFRTQWDSTALDLRVLDSDESTNAALLYWLVKFPYFIANRDYVFKRRFLIDDDKKEVVIVSESLEDTDVEKVAGVQRVKEYWSVMVLRSFGKFTQPGMEYTLTYFDNPGTSLPTAVTNFIATAAFPDYLYKLHNAAMTLETRWNQGEDIYVTLPQCLKCPNDSIPFPQLPSFAGTAAVTSNDVVKGFPDGQSIQDRRENDYTMLTAFPKDAVDYVGYPNKEMEESHLNEISPDHFIELSLKSKKVVIDLLEAMELVGPSLNKKMTVMPKIQNLVEMTNSDKSSSYIQMKLSEICLMARKFVDSALVKKEHSVNKMNELRKKRKSHYDHFYHDESAKVILSDFLESMAAVFQEDLKRRTGKGLLIKSVTSELETKEAYVPNVMEEHLLPDKHSVDVTSDSEICGKVSSNSCNMNLGICDTCNVKEDECHCCACQTVDDSSLANHNKPFWAYFPSLPYVSSFWAPNITYSQKENSGHESFCRMCSCPHKTSRGAEDHQNCQELSG